MAHTPGPWHIWGEDDWWNSGIDDLVVVASDIESGDDEQGVFICNIGAPISAVFADIEKNPNMANARLIAKAPEMLGLLREAKEALSKLDEEDVYDGLWCNIHYCIEGIEGKGDSK